jgi:hypothetical protein
MTKHEAIEKCARATVKRQYYREDQWRQYPTHIESVENIVVVAAGAAGNGRCPSQLERTAGHADEVQV